VVERLLPLRGQLHGNGASVQRAGALDHDEFTEDR